MSEILNRRIPIDLVDPHPHNYRDHPKSQIGQITASYEEFDQYRSVVVWARPGGRYCLVAGHGVVTALREKGVEWIRTDILPEETPSAKIEAILAADNLLSRGGQDNQALLNQILRSQLQAERNPAALGLTTPETDRLLHSILAEQQTDFLSSVLGKPSVPLPTSTRSLPEQKAFPLKDEEEYITMNFAVDQAQREMILAAIRLAKQRWTVHTQAQALFKLSEYFLTTEQ